MCDPPPGPWGLAVEKQESFLLSTPWLAGNEQEQSPEYYSPQYSQSQTREI